LARRRGKRRAIVATGNSVLTIIWHPLADPEARYRDLGPDYYQSKTNKQRRRIDLIRQLEHPTDQKVTLHDYPPPKPNHHPNLDSSEIAAAG
jgi:hypothetical protein